MELLLDCLEAQQLTALNTWTGRRNAAYTYEQGQARTQLDYLFTRRSQATALMRSCRPLQFFPMAAWRLSNLHRPLVLKVDYRWRPQQASGGDQRVQVEQLKQDMKNHTPHYQAYVDDMNAELDQQHCLNMEAVNSILVKHTRQCYSACASVRRPYFESLEVQQVIKSKWHHLSCMRKNSRTDLKSMFGFWKHYLQFAKLKKASNQASRHARRARFEGMLHEVEQYEAQNNIHMMYKVVRRLAPKQPYKKVQIYHAQGHILSKTEEAQEIHDHFSRIFQGREPVVPAQGHVAQAFTADELLGVPEDSCQQSHTASLCARRCVASCCARPCQARSTVPPCPMVWPRPPCAIKLDG